jgi:dihydroneopterin aldolase
VGALVTGTTLDVIRISNVCVDCIVGILPHERTKTQPLVVEVDLWLDLQYAAMSERIEDTVDYSRVRDDVARILVEGQFQLIETAAERIAAHALATAAGPTVARVRVRVAKPEAIAPALAAVEITRTR